MKKIVLLLVIFLFSFSLVAEEKADGKFDYGFHLRLRQEYLRNPVFFDNQIKDNQNYFRLKTSVWGKWQLTDNIDFFAQLSGEPRYYMTPSDYLQKEEFFFENLYFDFKDIFGLPVDLRIGRQNIIYGEGFLVLEGTTRDGGRSIYFNAAKATWKINDKNSVDIVYLNNPRYDKYLWVINDQDMALTRSDEQAIILYGKLNPNEKLSMEPYYIHKIEDNWGAIPELKLNTIGIRNIVSFNPWKLRSELAYQFGEYDDDDSRNALGGYVYLSRAFKEAQLSPCLDIGVVYLSGKTPGAGNRVEGWNPLFSRHPWISELYIYGYLTESDIAYWTNLQMLRTKLDLALTKKTALSFSYNFLRANKTMNGGIFGNGKNRGHLPQVILNHSFNKNLSAHLWCEYFIPGNFYTSDNRDPSMFLRWQLEFKY
jgi:hypothetical protein